MEEIIYTGTDAKDPEDTITAFPRVTGCAIREHFFDNSDGEVLEVRAVGTWGPYKYPVSLHITVPVNCGAVPMMGDNIRLDLRREVAADRNASAGDSGSVEFVEKVRVNKETNNV